MTLLASTAKFEKLKEFVRRQPGEPSIGLFDSGSGGLTIYQALSRSLPGENFIYLGDHANAPYGERDADDILALTRDAVDSLFRLGAGLVLLACNTAATVALRKLQEDWLEDHWPDRRILGVHIPVVEYLTGLRWDREEPGHAPHERGRVAVFATPGTIKSGAYAGEIERRAPNVKVYEIACPGLAQAIEDNDRSRTEALILRAWDRLEAVAGENGVDAAVLGCTHYPLAGDLFRAVIPAKVDLLSQPQIVADALADYLCRHPEYSTAQDSAPGNCLFLSTGEIQP